VLLLASKPPPSSRLAKVTARLVRDQAVTVDLVVIKALAALEKPSGLGQIHSLVEAAEGHGPAFRRSLIRLTDEERYWLYVSNDEWVGDRAASAQVALGLDAVAQHSAQKLSEQYRHLTVASSIDQALDSIDRKVSGSPSLWKRVRRRWGGSGYRTPRSIGAGKTSLAASDQPVGDGHADDLATAERVVLQQLRDLVNPRDRADLLGSYTNAALAKGQIPGVLAESVAAELASADLDLAAGLHADAATSFMEAMRVAYHRTAHLDGLESPMARNPESFAEPIRQSAVVRTLQAPRGRSTTAQRREPARRRRVLLATWGNANFLGELRAYLDAHPDVDVEFVDAKDTKQFGPWARDPAKIVEQVVAGGADLAAVVETTLRPHLDWADVVFADWCTVLPALLTAIDPGDTKVIVRLHSVEAFTFWPQLVDFGRVDHVVFVSEHLRDLTMATVPGLKDVGATETQVLPLALNLEKFKREKPAGTSGDPRFNLGLIGWSAVAKDPRWALEVIQKLRTLDGRYRLLLFGHEFDNSASRAAEAYGAELWPELETLESHGAVERRPHTDDVPAALQEVGIILSTSVREGCHTAVMEAAASAAVPVVRDWPFFSGRPNGASTMFPSEWVVATPEQAVERIIATTATEETWRSTGEMAQAEAFRRWGWENVKPEYDRLLLG
jgi:glycosyltransferase involved in cell wall biosynthesis